MGIVDKMSGKFDRLAIVGGGTAGWLTACLIAARRPELAITLVEAPDIPTIGVGEGTWPTMRETLATIGIAEAEFLRECDASFKQGSRFDGWTTGRDDDSYLHPFTAPAPGEMNAMLAAWQQEGGSFAEAMSAQARVCAADLAPRQRQMPDYAGALNYGYHLDAGKFAALLKRHATTRLGVTHLADHVDGVAGPPGGLIEALDLRAHGRLEADFFIDCSGMRALLVSGHCGVGWIDRSDVSFNDRALAVQVPVEPGSPIASQTVGTAHEAGWLWDIALPGRRGIGCVYSSRFLSDEAAAQTLDRYIARAMPHADRSALSPRLLQFPTGHRERIWAGNCLAIGMSAGFIEPLEASAIVMIELSCRMLADNYPQRRDTLAHLEERFNALFRYRWDRIVDFLKLHYVLSQREEPYWQAHRDAATIPPRLTAQLELWQDQPPSAWDFPQVDEIFSAASQQYVLYGMGFPAPSTLGQPTQAAARAVAATGERARALVSALPGNRAYLDALNDMAAPGAAHGELARS